MSLDLKITGIAAPIGSFLCNYIENNESLCSDIHVPIWGKIMHMNDCINLTGNEDWGYCPERKAFYFHCKGKVINQDEDVSFDHMICSRYIWVPNNRNLGFGDFSGGLGDIVFFHENSFHGSIDLFVTWLKQESEKGFPIQLAFSLEKPFICSVDFTNHAKYYGFENTSVIYDYFGVKKQIQLG